MALPPNIPELGAAGVDMRRAQLYPRLERRMQIAGLQIDIRQHPMDVPLPPEQQEHAFREIEKHLCKVQIRHVVEPERRRRMNGFGADFAIVDDPNEDCGEYGGTYVPEGAPSALPMLKFDFHQEATRRNNNYNVFGPSTVEETVEYINSKMNRKFLMEHCFEQKEITCVDTVTLEPKIINALVAKKEIFMHTLSKVFPMIGAAIGSGAFGTVYKHRGNTDLCIKVRGNSPKKDGWLEWATFCKDNSGKHPFLPKVHHLVITDTFYMAVLDKYRYTIENSPSRLSFGAMYSGGRDGLDNVQPDTDCQLCPVYKHYYELGQKLRSILPFGVGDLHKGNWMIDGSGELKLIDPVGTSRTTVKNTISLVNAP